MACRSKAEDNDGNLRHYCPECCKEVPLRDWVYSPIVYKDGGFIHKECHFIIMVTIPDE